MLVALSLGLAACGSTQDGQTSGSSTFRSTSPNVDGNVPDAMDFTAELVGGGTFTGASIAGQPLVLWFWGPT